MSQFMLSVSEFSVAVSAFIYIVPAVPNILSCSDQCEERICEGCGYLFMFDFMHSNTWPHIFLNTVSTII